MGYSVKQMAKAYEAGKFQTALNQAMHLGTVDEKALAVIKEAYEGMKNGMDVTAAVVAAGVKEVEVMMGIENKAVATAENNEEVEVMVENNAVETKAEVTAEAEVEPKVETAPEANPWILITGKKKSTDLYMTVFEGDSRAKLEELQKEGYTFVCLATVSRFLKLLATNWKGGKEVVKNLSKKNVSNADEFVNNVLALYKAYGECEKVELGADGDAAGSQVEVENADGTVKVVAA